MYARLVSLTKDPGFWSMVDQSVVSAGNFVTTILLARALPPVEYGIYALLFALMLFVISVHSALIAYGLSVHGAAGTESTLGGLTGGSLILTAILGVTLGAAIASVSIGFHRGNLAFWIFLAVLFWQFQETTRRALMSRLRHRDAIWGDLLSYIGQAVWIAYLFIAGRLTLASAFVAMAATSAIALLFQMAQLKLAVHHFAGSLDLISKFWEAGRWALLANLAQAFIAQALLWLLALRGMAEVASFQSLLNLLRVANPVMLAMGSVLLPAIALQKEGASAGWRITQKYAVLGGLVLLPYFGGIFLFPHFTLQVAYGHNSPYSTLGASLQLLIIGSVFAYLAHMLGSYYYGLSRSDIVWYCQLVTAVVTVVAGVLFVREAGVLGAVVANDLAYIAQTGAFVWYLRKVRGEPPRLPFLSMGAIETEKSSREREM